MTSKMIADRIRSMQAVRGSLEQNARSIEERIGARLGALLRGEERMPEWALAAQLLGRELEALADVMEAADLAHGRELADDAGPRASRDRHAAEVREIYSDLRVALSSTYGGDVLARMRVASAAGSTPAELARQGQAAREALLDASIVLPEPRRRGSRIDREAFAEELSVAVLALSRALEEVDRESKEADVSHAAKLEAIDAYDAAFARIVPAIAALYMLAGQDTLAAKLRVNRRRRGVLEDPTPPGSPDSSD